MGIRDFLPPIVRKTYLKVLNLKSKFPIGNYSIDLPLGHMLPANQREYRLYDRFLPVLAKHLGTDGVIIDVGANVGDTTIALLQYCSNPILAIEPSEEFFAYLKKNLGCLPPSEASRVMTVKKLVGSGSISGELVHAPHGTASIRVTSNTHVTTHVPLDTLLEDPSKVSLLKVDTDGFDFDVIQSARKILLQSEPVIFWENEIADEFQRSGYNAMQSLLREAGYEFFYIFDGYGNLMLERASYETLTDLNSYLLSMARRKSSWTFMCVNVLASTKKYHEVVKKGIDQFKAEFIGT